MKLEITSRKTKEFEKDLGEDDSGRPMITTLRFRHWTVRSDEDLRPHITEGQVSWYNCQMRPAKGSRLEDALRVLGGWDRLPGLSGIRSVSDDGLEMEFCWR